MSESILQVLKDYRKLPFILALALQFLQIQNAERLSSVVQYYCHNIECLELVNQLFTFMTFFSVVLLIFTAIWKNNCQSDKIIEDYLDFDDIFQFCAVVKWIVVVITVAATGDNFIPVIISGMNNCVGLGCLLASGGICVFHYLYLKNKDS